MGRCVVKVNYAAETGGDKVFTVLNYVILTLFAVTVLYPLVAVVSNSVSSPVAVGAGKVWLWPVDLSLDGYKAIFEYKKVWTGFGNSLYYTIVGTAVNIIFTLLAAYPLSRMDFYGRNVFMSLFVFTMIFHGGIIPTYMVVKELGMVNTPWALIIPGAISVWNVIITRTYFKTTIPQEVLDSAQIDGCSDLKFLIRMVIPLSAPIIAVNALFYAVNHWNTYFNALIYLSNAKLFPLQLVLREVLVLSQVTPDMLDQVSDAARLEGMTDVLKYALIVVSTLPLLILYPFVQKHFVRGVMIGSLKG
ncbi:carbohydrate ABC transporter permease [Paenibacillus radicis (ex Xue et al. 2023)]|uniref:Carbohydrate ABC transporter permease n=1 Tax=Paenibacillus radicis (ex Xue et al. 2023) TaxID=2972489 RepID=A0ABT1YGF1_9BACL|nr:carbohydrate ABC transporter permease [Paenibacillus radicis (ex Xue et al. 2023)]MCR8632256.1 carbohydrate ABC transporter permease [Paenibacillus radicis (ex Xue et al. 2023)]